MKVYLIVLHYQNLDDTQNCLASISKLEKGDFQVETVLVNNDPKIKIDFRRKNLTVINNPDNFGFAKGINVGIRKALEDKEAGYFLILNNDTLLLPNLLINLLQIPAEIVGPVIKFKSLKGKWIYDYGGKINWWTGRTFHLEAEEYTKGWFFKEKIDYVSGCCMLVARKVFETIGLFDENYFFYFEDADFCTKARKAGFQIAVASNAVLEHKLGGSIGRWTKKAIYYNLKGNFLFVRKNLKWRQPIGYFYLFLLGTKILWDKIKEKRRKS